MKTLYADTYIWNQLHSQRVDPRTLWTTLALKGLVPVLGIHDIYELANTFRSGKNDDHARELFDYVRRYLDIPILVLSDNGDLLKRETRNAAGEPGGMVVFELGPAFETIIFEVDKLRRGEFGPDVADFITKRKDKAERSRSEIKKQLAAQPDFVSELKTVTLDALPEFLRSRLTDFRAAAGLGSHLLRLFPSNSAEEIARAAILIKDCERCKISRALTRAHFYLRWRFVKYGSIRDDLFDDVFHVVNAAYCDYFLTTETRQAEYARLIVPEVSVILADRTEKIIDRLAAELPLNRTVEVK